MRVWLRRIGIALGALALIIAALLIAADTGPGHRFIANRIEALAPSSGLKIGIGRIDGSIYGETRITGLTLSDPDGMFFIAPSVTMDWSPFAWLGNRLDIDSLKAKQALLVRLPRLRPSTKPQPVLPGFDIHVGDFAIDRLRIARGVAGDERVGRVSGKADVRDGRADVKLVADADQGDRLNLVLDAEPDRNRFDLEAAVDAPAGGVFGAMLGTARPVSLRITGDGSWKDWRGQAQLDVDRAPAARLGLVAQSGRYALDGRLTPGGFLQGKLQRLASPAVRVRGNAVLANRRLDGRLQLDSPALALGADGVVDLAQGGFDDLLIDGRLLQPQALFPNITGRDIALKIRLDGPFSRAGFDYLLTAPRVAFDTTGFEEVRVSGQGRLSAPPVRVPVRLSARRVTGVGDVAGGILNNISVDGLVLVTGKTVVGDGLILKSDKLSGKLSVFLDLVTGRYDVGLAGQLSRYLIPGLGIVDVKSELRAVPGLNGQGTRILGRGQAWVRRFDNAFLRDLAGGLPMIDTGLERTPDGIIHFRGLKLVAPALRLAGNGYRRRDGTFFFEGSGVQSRYGPVQLALDGQIARPKITLLLARPNDAMGLSNVRLSLDPLPNGFAWSGNGRSLIGPFTGKGTIALPAGRPAVIGFADLNASGMRARGALTSLPGGFSGPIELSGAGISGLLSFEPRAGVQAITANLTARDAELEGPPRIAARRGKFDGVILLDPRGASVEGTLTGQGMQYGGLSLARLAANINLKGGVGEVRASLAGSRGRSFDFQTVAQISPNRYEIVGSGTLDRKPIRLTAPAIFTREGGGWRLAPTALEFAGGSARVGGKVGGNTPELSGTVARMPVAILDMFYPGLGLGGVASGDFAYRAPAGVTPSGSANLTIRGLTRSGLVLSSKPVDLGIAATLNGSRAGARLVAASGNATLGRAQIQLTGIAPGGDLPTRLANAPMFAQLRFNGAADTLWRLAGVEAFDISGNVAIGADLTGRLNDPQIRGSLRTANARVESAAAGMVLTNVNANGRFSGSRLVLDRFDAVAGREGRVTGTGSVDFSRATGEAGIDFSLNATRAALLNRDDIGATVTGPIRIRSDANGGVISGDVTLSKAHFRLGRATAAGAVPRLNVREINGRADLPVTTTVRKPWRLAMTAKAANEVIVTGLGIDSEWDADLTIGGTIDSPALTGRSELLRGGYEFAGRGFELTRGIIRFQGQSPPDPIIDITAQGATQGLNATIRVTGTGQKPEIAFSSIPALPQDELLARLLFGTSVTNLSAPEAVQLAAAVAALRGGGDGLNPINAIRNAIGLDRLRILPADTATGQRTSIAAGKYLGRRIYVEVITDGQGYSATRAEFQITRWLAILSSISSIGEQSASVRVSKDY